MEFQQSRDMIVFRSNLLTLPNKLEKSRAMKFIKNLSHESSRKAQATLDYTTSLTFESSSLFFCDRWCSVLFKQLRHDDAVQGKMKTFFDVKFHKELQLFIRCKTTRTSQSITITHTSYCKRLLKRTKLNHAIQHAFCFQPTLTWLLDRATKLHLHLRRVTRFERLLAVFHI